MQQQLQDLNKRVRDEQEGGGDTVDHKQLGQTIDALKEEFTELITKLRQRRIAVGQNVLSDKVMWLVVLRECLPNKCVLS